jgi:hypothetical protein
MGILGNLDLGHTVLVVDHTGYSWTARWDLSEVAGVVAMVVILLTPAIIITALLIAAVFAMPVLVGHVTGATIRSWSGAWAAPSSAAPGTPSWRSACS